MLRRFVVALRSSLLPLWMNRLRCVQDKSDVGSLGHEQDFMGLMDLSVMAQRNRDGIATDTHLPVDLS
jgi:hypothetical protein